MSSNPYIIAIAGPSCAGKSELAGRLSHELLGSVLLLDSYYRDLSSLAPDERARVNFDEPRALDHELLVDQVRALGLGRTVNQPRYDFATHTRIAVTERFSANRVLIIEGLFALYWPELRTLAGTKVFVDAPDHVCLHRRLHRDTAERGRTAESVVWQFNETVQPMAERHVRPTAEYADLILSGEQALECSVASVLQHTQRNINRELSVSASGNSMSPPQNSIHETFALGQR